MLYREIRLCGLLVNAVDMHTYKFAILFVSTRQNGRLISLHINCI